ncbi:MAG: cyclase family protein, partial [Thermoplasmata archaeon]
VAMSSHSGTHVDPPRHFVQGGAGIDQVDLGILNGPARVVQIPSTISALDLEAVRGVPPGTERVLFRTRNSERWPPDFTFFPDYVGLEDSAAAELLRRGVRLVGIDSLSVERDDTGAFPVHHRLLGGGALIIEGLVLGAVPEGMYELACLPLRIVDGDGGPCRAVLTSP